MVNSSYKTGMRSRRRPIGRLLLGLVLVAVGIWIIVVRPNASEEQNRNAGSGDSGNKAEELAYDNAVGKYLFSGTVVIARAVENEARRSDGSIDYSQPFSKFDTFEPEQYDAWEFDHECPMTMNNIPYRQQVQNTIFNCRPEFLPAMREHFPAIIANVANNHTRDMGDDGYGETVKLLEEGGLQTIGNYSPRVKDDICEVVALPIRLQKAGKTEGQGLLPVAFCAWHYFEFDPQPGELEEMDRYAEVMPVFAFMQVGVEYRPTADPRQVEIGRRIVDRGPEFLIGNSPHWVQNTEVYKDTLIVYSTGNFIFDQLDTETNRGLSIAADMAIPYDENVAKWLEFGETCRERGDDCLERAKQQGLSKVSLELTYEAIASTTGYRNITQKADAATQKAVEDRANWEKTLQELGQQ